MITIIVGENHNNTLGLVRSLGEVGHEVYLLLCRDTFNYVAKSKYVKKTFYVNNELSIPEQIKMICNSFQSRPVVFCSSDEYASLLNSCYDELSQYCYLEGGKDINLYRNKDKGNDMASFCGFCLPRTWMFYTKRDNVDNIAFPVIVKANNSIHGGKKDLQVVDCIDKLNEVINGIDDSFFPIQVQEYIIKDYELMILGCSIAQGSNILATVAQRKIRFFPNEYNAGSFSKSIKIDDDPSLVDLRMKLSNYMNQIHYTGLFSAEFVFSQGKYFFLEVNLRNDGTSYLSTCCGCNLPDILCKYFNGEKVITIGDYKPGLYMVNVSDFGNVLKKKISFYTWLKDFKRSTCYSHYNKHDIKPYIAYLISFFNKKLQCYLKDYIIVL